MSMRTCFNIDEESIFLSSPAHIFLFCFEIHYHLDERVPRVRAQPNHKLIHITELLTDQELKTSPVYNEALVPNHMGNSITVRMAGPDGTRINWEVADPIDGNPADNARLQNLLKDALPLYGQHGASGSMTVKRPATSQPLVLHVNPVNQPQADDPSWLYPDRKPPRFCCFSPHSAIKPKPPQT